MSIYGPAPIPTEPPSTNNAPGIQAPTSPEGQGSSTTPGVGTVNITAPSTSALPALSGKTWLVLGAGTMVLILLSGTSWGPAVIALLIAALVYEGVHGGPFQNFLTWLNGG